MGEKKEQQSHIPTRLNVLFLLVFLFFASIILRLAYVQLVEGEQYKHALEKYSTRELPIPAPRGRILDRNGEVLVTNKPVYTVTYVKDQNGGLDEKQEEQIADKLAGILSMDDAAPGTDKDLLKKTIELHASLPVAFDKKATEQLISMIQPKLKMLPKAEQIDTMTDYKLIQTALTIGVRVRSPFDSKDRDSAKQIVTKLPIAKNVNVKDMTDSDLLRFVMKNNISIKIALDKDDRTDLVKGVKTQLSLMPDPNALSKNSDMDLLKYASLFDLNVPLPLTDQQRKFQWHKLEILKEMRSYNLPSYIPRRVKVNITDKEMFKIEERRSELPGISVELEPMRLIPKDPDGSPFATHILGHITPISPEQVDEYKAQGYNPFDLVGKSGLERYYERYLRGKDGAMEVHVNKNSETIEKRQSRAPEPGDDLILALDRRFQSKVEDIVKNQFNYMKTHPGFPKDIQNVHALAMDPNTGEILAMASYPDYDLNLYYDRKEFNKVYKTLILPNESNKFIYAAYPPGSTVKPLSVMLALQEKLTTPGETIFDRGGLQFWDQYKRNWKLSGHGPVNARRALQVSNNTYMYMMAKRLAERDRSHWWKQFSVLDFYNQQFGLGVKTGVDLPFETAGVQNPNLYIGNLADAFIGQYDIFTPMQLGQYVSTIANGGYRIRPHLVKEIRKGTTDPKKPGPVITEMKPDILNHVQIDSQWIKVVQEGMHMVTLPGGTASRTFAGLPFNVAAKTGTAQTGKKTDNALMVGYAPYENPKIAFVVIIPNGLLGSSHSSDASGPIARQMLEAYNELYPGLMTGGQSSTP